MQQNSMSEVAPLQPSLTIPRCIGDGAGHPTNAAPLSFLFRRASRFVSAIKYFSGISLPNYTLRQRVNLAFALLSHGNETRLLNFHVSYLDQVPFRFLLKEIFFKREYFFEADSGSPLILDCGANIGLSVLFFKYLYPSARIRAFEADPATASILQKNVEQNRLGDVSAHCLMLSNVNGEHPFYVAADMPGSLRMSGSPGRVTNAREIMVKAGKLSDYISEPVDLLKLDVEGAEFDVMSDLKSSGKIALIQRMVIEYHHKIGGQASCMSRFLALLEDEGFEYQISGECDPITRGNVFQDIVIGAYRPVAAGVGANPMKSGRSMETNEL